MALSCKQCGRALSTEKGERRFCSDCLNKIKNSTAEEAYAGTPRLSLRQLFAWLLLGLIHYLLYVVLVLVLFPDDGIKANVVRATALMIVSIHVLCVFEAWRTKNAEAGAHSGLANTLFRHSIKGMTAAQVVSFDQNVAPWLIGKIATALILLILIMSNPAIFGLNF